MESHHHLLKHPHIHFLTPPFTPKLSSSLLNLKPHKPHLLFSSTSQPTIKPPSTNPKKPPNNVSKPCVETLKQTWLSSLSWRDVDGDAENELEVSVDIDGGGRGGGGCGSHCVIGIDPDVSGALAIVKPKVSGFSAQVFDSPYVQVSVGKTLRKRLDARSIVQLLQNIEAPKGTIAYLEQSIPYPQDGKQGWWSGGFSYGLWIGILVASGFSVVPVPSSVWKKEFQLVGSRSSKDESRELAAKLFPDLSPMLKRKKDHGRAEALLIAAYGKGLNPRLDESCKSTIPAES